MKGFVFLKRFPLKMSVLNENNDVFIHAVLQDPSLPKHRFCRKTMPPLGHTENFN